MAATRLTRCLCLRHPIETMLEIYKSPPSRFQKLNWWNIHWAMAKSLFPACLPCWPSQAWWPFQVSIYSTQDFVILQERRIIYIATPIQFPGPQSIWLLRYFIRLSQSGPSLFGCCCLVTLPSFQPMNPELCYFAREDDYIYCNSSSISRTQIHFVVEIFYTPVTESGSFAAILHCWCLVTLSTFHLFNPGLCYFAWGEDYIYCNSCSISRTQIHLVVEIFYTPVTIWAFTFWLLVPGDPPKFPANEPRTLLFCKRGGLYILQLLFNSRTQIHLVVEGFYCPVTKSGSFAAVPLLPGDPLKFPVNEPRTLLFCKRGGLYILQLLFNSQDLHPFGCGGILLPCHQIWQFCCCSLLPGDPLKFPANEPRTLLFCKRGGLYILQLLFNSQDLHPFCCGGIILLCHQIL